MRRYYKKFEIKIKNKPTQQAIMNDLMTPKFKKRKKLAKNAARNERARHSLRTRF